MRRAVSIYYDNLSTGLLFTFHCVKCVNITMTVMLLSKPYDAHATLLNHLIWRLTDWYIDGLDCKWVFQSKKINAGINWWNMSCIDLELIHRHSRGLYSTLCSSKSWPGLLLYMCSASRYYLCIGSGCSPVVQHTHWLSEWYRFLQARLRQWGHVQMRNMLSITFSPAGYLNVRR